MPQPPHLYPRLRSASPNPPIGDRRRRQSTLAWPADSLRHFDRAQVIDSMKQLDVPFLNAKDVKDHLPLKPPEVTKDALAAYSSAGIKLTAAGTIYFPKDEDSDIEEKFDYCRRAGISLIVGSPTHESLARVEKFIKQYDIRLG